MANNDKNDVQFELDKSNNILQVERDKNKELNDQLDYS